MAWTFYAGTGAKNGLANPNSRTTVDVRNTRLSMRRVRRHRRPCDLLGFYGTLGRRGNTSEQQARAHRWASGGLPEPHAHQVFFLI